MSIHVATLKPHHARFGMWEVVEVGDALSDSEGASVEEWIAAMRGNGYVVEDVTEDLEGRVYLPQNIRTDAGATYVAVTETGYDDEPMYEMVWAERDEGTREQLLTVADAAVAEGLADCGYD